MSKTIEFYLDASEFEGLDDVKNMIEENDVTIYDEESKKEVLGSVFKVTVEELEAASDDADNSDQLKEFDGEE